jgi:UDPglucose 6-dehydrogenase
MIKLMSNAFLATKVTFANVFYDICAAVGANYEMVRMGVTSDKRIGESHMRVPGYDGKRGFSGSCFPKDLGNISETALLLGLDNELICAVLRTNSRIREDHDWVDNRYRKGEADVGT